MKTAYLLTLNFSENRTFQLNDYLIIEMNDHIESAAIHLTQLKQGTGKYYI
jgi:hypothetical protein